MGDKERRKEREAAGKNRSPTQFLIKLVGSLWNQYPIICLSVNLRLARLSLALDQRSSSLPFSERGVGEKRGEGGREQSSVPSSHRVYTFEFGECGREEKGAVVCACVVGIVESARGGL